MIHGDKATMASYALELDQAKAYYDPEQEVVYVAYEGILGAEAPAEVYNWLEALYNDIDVKTMYAQIFDFRKVTAFDDSNLKTARRTSSRMNMSVDISHVPVALIVSDPYHQEILLGSMRISPDHMRKKIVWSEDEAYDFFEQWHANRE